jgi:pSer/pThr/pTyr-binding forkhead associated (FHA) protein
MGEIIIEIQSRTGNHTYVKFSHPSIRIGRAYDNDLIIADPYVSPHHAIINLSENSAIITDMSSTNGTVINKEKPIETPTEIFSGDCLVLGKTTLRILDSAHNVSPAISLSPRMSSRMTAAIPLYAMLSLLFFIVVLYALQLSNSYKDVKPITLLAQILPILFAPLLWSGVWSLVGHLTRKKAHFGIQYTITNVSIILMIVSSVSIEYVDYYTGNIQLAKVLEYSTAILFSTATLFGNLVVSSGVITIRRFVLSFGIIGFLALTVAITEHSGSLEDKISPKYSTTLKPPFVKLVKPHSYENYLKECESLFDSKSSSKEKP